MSTNAEQITTATVVGLLRGKYAMPKYAFITEVPDGTSTAKTGACDAMAMGCWLSVGVHLHGFEIKVSRSDWLKELRNRNKSAKFERYCHYWTVVAPRDVVKPEELPAEWGLMLATQTRLSVKSAPSLRSPEMIDHMFLAAMMRRALNVSPAENELREARSDSYRQGYNDGSNNAKKNDPEERTISRLTAELKNLKCSVERFEAASGVRITSYNGNRIGEAVACAEKFLNRNGDLSVLKRASHSAKRLADYADLLVREIESFKSTSVTDH